MKKTTFLLILISLLSVTNAFARRGITYGTVDKLVRVADLPNTEKYQVNEKADTGQNLTGYFDLAIIYSHFEIAGMPLWIKKEPVLVMKSTFYKDRYYDITDEELNEILKENNLNKEELLKLSFMDKYLGWVVILGIFLLSFIFRKFFSRNDQADNIEYDQQS